MSYLELSTGIADFKQAVISLWFRVPQASMDSLVADDSSGVPLAGVLPLVTFGKTFHDSSDDAELSPCYIGIVWDRDKAGISVNIQLSDHGTYSGGYYDENPVTMTRPEWFLIDPSGEGYRIEVAADSWHHLLLSFDLTHDISTVIVPRGDVWVDSYCKMWISLDDKNCDGTQLNEIGVISITPFLAGFDPNAIVTTQYSLTPPSDIIGIGGATDGAYFYRPSPIPSVGENIGSPADSRYVLKILPVELAELQFFTEVTLDTSNESNRRAFVDADGKPVPPVATPDDPSDPNSPSHTPAERLLGKKPDIVLHGSGNWISGTNTGPPFVPDPNSPDPNNPIMIPDPDFAFTPTGQIIAFSPDPSLGSPTPPPALSGEARRQQRMMASA
jgi:hypothetical protein